jgi:hypothetical protein
MKNNNVITPQKQAFTHLFKHTIGLCFFYIMNLFHDTAEISQPAPG